MEEKEKKAAGAELDIKRIALTLVRKWWIIAIVGALCAAIAFVWTFYYITPQYKSSTKFYVNSSTVSIGDVNVGLSMGDLSAAQELVNSYIVILQSRETLNEIVDYAEVNISADALRGMISANSVNGTEVFEVVVTHPNPYVARDLAYAVAKVLPNRIGNIIDGTSAKVVEWPVVPGGPSSPSYSRNTIIGLLAGAMASVLVIFLYVVFDITIRSDEDIQRICDAPVLAAVPDMTSRSKGGYYYNTDKKRIPSGDKEGSMVGANVSFAAMEAYKLMRTKLQFSFVDEQKCHVIGVCSAMAGEGKSVTSVNLAYSMAQLDKRVLLIDCDMRRPSLNIKLGLKKIPGLSNYLTRQVQEQEAIQKYGDEEANFDVICAGRNPPNPIELLSSLRMKTILEEFREKYDYIILDLPPIEEVSDALVASKLVDGTLLVVRQNYCNTHALSGAVKQFDFVESRILGIVLNCSSDKGARYYKNRYRGYRNRYEGSYAKAAKQDGKS